MTLSFGLVLTGRVEAQDDRARLHFQAGASYYEAGDYEDALREFQRSHALSQRSELFYNFSLCYQQLGDIENAALYLRRFLDEVESIENRDQLERRHGNLVERIAQREAGTTPGGEPTPSEESGTAPEEGAEAASDESASASDTGSGRGSVPVGAVIGYAAAGVGLVLAATFGPLALKERGRIEDGCGATRTCTAGEVAQMDGFALAADIGLVMTVAGATVGTILLLTGRGDDEAENPEQARVRFAPYASPMGAGGVLRGSF